MSKKQIDLSRRKLIAGLGTAGVAAAGAGLGTTAYLNDTESFEDNSITAGTLDMSVTATVEAANGYWEENADLPMEATADGEAVTALQVEDAKPGDWGIICFDIEVGENPGYVQVSAANLVNDENTVTEPEADAEGENNDETDDEIDGDGELGENLLVDIYRPAPEGDVNGPDDLGDPVDSGVPINQLVNALSDGIQVGEAGPESPLTGCLHLYIPEDVGNVIQSDSVSFDLVFEAEQVRNNDNPFTTAE